MAQRKTELFDSDLGTAAEFFRLLGHPARLAVLEELAEAKSCQCGHIVTQLPLAQATVSQHLKKLKEGGLIAGTLTGPAVCYCIDQKTVIQMIESGRAFLNRLESDITTKSSACCEENRMNNSKTIGSDEDQIKEAVRERYRESAEKGGCCSSGTGCGCATCDTDVVVDTADYAKQQGYVSDADLGLGCGIPTKFAAIKPGEVVLDLGSGAGNDVFIAAMYVGSTGKVIGVDMTPEMITKARRIAKERNFTNVEFRLGEIEALPVADNTADLAISNCVINLVPDKSRVFAELARTLKPGGRFVISDIVTTGTLPEAILSSLDQYVGCVAGASTQSAYELMMQTAGFQRIEIAERRVIDRKSWDIAGDAPSEVDVLSVTFVAYK
jgi:SAM-dependent methyltransferase